MMETANTQKPARRYICSHRRRIEFQTCQDASNGSQAEVVGASQTGDSDTTLQLHDGESICRLDQEVYFLSQ